MPTGYTAPILEKGIGFKEFAMNCARAFGACIEMRDDPMDKPIPESFEPSDYHQKALKADKKNLRVLEAMDQEARESFGRTKLLLEIQAAKDGIARKALEKQRLEAVKEDCMDWVPPTREHEGLKKFMLQQIDSTMDFDCSGDYWEHSLLTLEATKPIYKWQEAVDEAKDGIDYHERELAKDIDRAKGNTEWVKALRESLNTDPIAA